jgi:CheY-like chemotaxis protein
VTKILYVEDNDDNVYMLKMRFELLDGFEVLVAENGEIGCEKAVVEMPDIILMDLDLPVVDGWEAARRIKSDQRTRHIPIIALTAHAMPGSREKALAAGCDEFDTKPVEFDRLMQKINFVLHNRSAGR